MARRVRQDPAYPWAGHPRRFMAVAMPNGDARFGVEGPLVMVTEKRRHCLDRVRIFSRDEAEALVAELQAGLRAFDLAKDMAHELAGAGPRACTAPYPFRDHRTLAECPPRKEAPAVTGDDRR